MEQADDIGFNSMVTMMMEISQGSPDNTIDLDEARQFIVPRIANYLITYDENKEEHTEINYYPMHRCIEEDFETEFEIDYF